MGRLNNKKKVLRSRGRSSIPKELVNFGYHLVFSEGTVTEPNYIENIKERIASNFSCSKGIINIHPHVEEGTYHTLSLVAFAETKTRELLNKGIKVDHVWIFYDKDSFKKDDFDNTFSAIDNRNYNYENIDGDPCDENGIVWHACWSNEAFELWLLLHFQSVTSAISRKDYIKKINSKIANTKYGLYQKNNKHIFDLIEINNGSVAKAIKYAKDLDNKTNEKSNPSTGVYKFAMHFYRYIYKGEKLNDCL